MAGSSRIVDTASGITASRSVKVDSRGGHAAASFIADVTAITRTTGSLVIILNYDPGNGSSPIVVATKTGIIATGVVKVPLHANFSATRFAIPEPNNVIWSLIGDATAVSGLVVAQ